MSKPTIKIHNVETDEVIEREMTVEEIEQYTEYVKQEEEAVKAEKNRQEAKANLFSKLGITEEEAKLLLG
jgi:methionine aminopeptidase